MPRSFHADGENWDVQLSREAPHEGVRIIIFRCTSNSSHGWRVVEVPVSGFDREESVHGLREEELRMLFERSQPFDYSHDPHARPDSIGEGTSR